MPIIQMHILEGRSDALKQKLVAEVTDAVSRTLGNPPESIRVLLYEIPKSHWAVGGTSMAVREAAQELGQAPRDAADDDGSVSVDDAGPGM